MAEEFSRLLKAIFIPVISNLENRMAWENWFTTMATVMKGAFCMIGCMERESISTPTGIVIRESSRMICPMDKASIFYQTGRYIQAYGKKAGWFPELIMRI